MRYEYTVTQEGGEAEIIKEMSWKKVMICMKTLNGSIYCSVANATLLTILNIVEKGVFLKSGRGTRTMTMSRAFPADAICVKGDARMST